jgi:DNA polymerase-3 subunit gamma/tau
MALYNKYRPTDLSMVCGQEQVKRVLISQINKKQLVHAYIFHGSAGTGKTTTARILCAMINATDGMTVSPKLDDPFVEQIYSGKSGIDVYEMDAASNRGIDDIKEMRKNAYYPPMQMRKKIYIIDECHMLTREAWNALLKLLEEPPEHAIFILCTTDLSKVIETVQTRCMMLGFRTPATDDVVQYIKKLSFSESIKISDDAIRQVVMSSRGSVRDAISKLEMLKHNDGLITLETVSEQLGVASRKSAVQFVGSVIEGGFIDSMKASTPCISKGVKPADFFSMTAEILRDLLIFGAKGYEMTDYGYTKEDQDDIKGMQEKLLKLCEYNYRRLVRKWLSDVQDSSNLTVLNTQPQFQIDVLFMTMKLNLQTEIQVYKNSKAKGG